MNTNNSERPTSVDAIAAWLANRAVRTEVVWQAFDACGQNVISVWTDGASAFRLELDVFRERLANRVDHIVLVRVSIKGTPWVWDLIGNSDYLSIEQAVKDRGVRSSNWPKRSGVGRYGPRNGDLRHG